MIRNRRLQTFRARSTHGSIRICVSLFESTRPQQRVQVQPGGDDNGLGKGPYDMVRDEKGNWTVTTPTAQPGFHYYWLIVDGLECNDPSAKRISVGAGNPAASKSRTKSISIKQRMPPWGRSRSLALLQNQWSVATGLCLHSAGL